MTVYKRGKGLVKEAAAGEADIKYIYSKEINHSSDE